MKKTFKMFLTVGISNWNEGNFSLQAYNPDNGDIKYRNDATVREVDVEVDVPETVDITALKLKALEDALEKDKADSFTRQNILIDQISKLKCLGHEEVEG